MKQIILILSLLLAINAISQTTVKDTLTMIKTSKKRSITISLPASYDKEKTKT